MPERIQQRRTKGWRMPLNARSVARPSKWGNPYKVGDLYLLPAGMNWPLPTTKEYSTGMTVKVATLDDVIRWHSAWIRHVIERTPDVKPIRELRGYDLACYCPLDQPCHADVLLELANQ